MAIHFYVRLFAVLYSSQFFLLAVLGYWEKLVAASFYPKNFSEANPILERIWVLGEYGHHLFACWVWSLFGKQGGDYKDLLRGK
jgi:hypothetical protein